MSKSGGRQLASERYKSSIGARQGRCQPFVMLRIPGALPFINHLATDSTRSTQFGQPGAEHARVREPDWL